ncbi:hypothetical protein BXZ70DRAFT_935941 [Cristinia sonorae]|uniref:Uncharacterized protein n=1 Tax=Cristinia sonorae TaxID=1940300 RepID=A0A8K0XPY9_9AGAR|nr:hypothetical protein BXZ70DRAFT_935941 [Cristinia sonorae]
MRQVLHRRVRRRIVVGPGPVVRPRPISLLAHPGVVVPHMVQSNPTCISIVRRVAFLVVPVWRMNSVLRRGRLHGRRIVGLVLRRTLSLTLLMAGSSRSARGQRPATLLPVAPTHRHAAPISPSTTLPTSATRFLIPIMCSIALLRPIVLRCDLRAITAHSL